MQATVFDIQRFSIYDGSGIRTNVFFKGCNLRCLWCHNPESQKAQPQLLFHKNKCIGCNKCTEVCDKLFTADCTACGSCARVCRTGARVISGKTMTVDEVFDIVIKDKEYYKTSGGGVTLSGGEPLLYADFCAELLRKCKEHGINTNIETAANVPWSSFEKVLPYLDTVMCDIKCLDEQNHIRCTDVSNKLILQNAEKLKTCGVTVIFRTPVIPGYNDNEVPDIARFCAPCRYELLAYHETGKSKYTALNKEYSLNGVAVPTRDYMENLSGQIGADYLFTGI